MLFGLEYVYPYSVLSISMALKIEF